MANGCDRTQGEWMIVGVICACGLSRRPAVKRPLSLDQTVHLIERVTRSYKAAALDQLLLVLGFEAKKILQQIPLQGLKIIINGQYRMGTSSALETGMRFLPSACEGMVIGLGDMPLVEPETIDHLVGTFTKTRKGIVYPVYSKQIGLPIVFDVKYRDELARLRGDDGPVEVIKKFAKDTKAIKVKTDTVIRDIASYEEFEEFVGACE
jgi:molybdenum cofactor cytidylyltransferase